MKTKLTESSSDTIRQEVRRRYGATARGESSCADDCCASTSSDTLGYSDEDSAFAPEAANLGLGCGNPLAIASLERGQTVLDLRTGARLAVADIVATAPLPEEVKGDWAAYTGCMAGASQIDDLEKMLRNAGFDRIKIAPKDASRSFIREWLPGKQVEEYLVSATIEATKPR